MQFGLDFVAVLDYNVRGFRSSHPQELYDVAQFWTTLDSDEE